MARVTGAAYGKLLVLSVLFVVTGTSASTARAEGVPPEAPDQKALGAFKTYWQAFEEYEDRTLREGEKKFSKSWELLKESWREDQAKISATQLEALQKAANRYRQQLTEHPDASNRPYVMLDLAQILNTIGDHLGKSDSSNGTFSKNEAITILGDLDRSYPGFPYREQALYLRAIILETLDRQDDALAAWRSLSATARSTIYGVHARVALGDHLFLRDRVAEATTAYQKALELLGEITVEQPDYERLRINYRLAWAAYRAAELNIVLKAAAEILTPGHYVKSAEKREKIRQDAIDLMGDALYEANNPAKTREVLSRKDLAEFAAAIALRTSSRYLASGVPSEAAAVADKVAEEQPLSKDTPALLLVAADAHGKLGKPDSRIQALERIAMLLPAQSLWRAKHRSDLVATRAMEDKARPAAVAVASSYYDTGLASGNVKAFRAGASYYDILLEHQPNGPESNTWRLRRAHCYYFSGELDEAAKLYAQLKSEFKVDDDTLQVASYQLVLAHEKRWRDAFAKAADQGNDPLKDTDTLAALAALEKSVDEFAARFPSQSRSIDLLLVAASAGRDMDKYDSASRYWQRVLVSQPTPAQRGLAVRGMVFARMKTGSPGDVVEAARRFLKLEDWNTLGANLANEMRGVLSAAALDEGKRLNGSGKVQDAGQMLTQVAEEFPDLPDRDRLWRDGAYMLAIAGDWGRAQKASENYFAAGMLKNRADMTYLLARAHEYQLKLLDAAKKYFELGEKYPSHTRAVTSLTRAEKLALAEGDYSLAAQAAAVQAEHAKRKPERLAHYARAVEYLDKADDPDKATSIAKRRLRASDTPGERIKSRLLLARATYKSGSEQEALDEITIISKDIDRQRAKLEPQEYAALAGETHFLLGEEARRKFEDFRIAERGGDAVAAKSRLFEELVASYDRAAAAGDPKWATQSRFLLAGAAESFADEVAGEPARTGQSPTSKAKSKYESTVDRLRALAKKYYSTNVLAARKDPARYRDDEWVKKSSLRLTGDASDLPETRHRDVIPTAARDDLPSDWSL